MTKDPAFANFADHFYEEKEAIEDLIEDTSQSQVKSRCKRVLKGLGVEGYEDVPEETTTRRVTKMPVAAKPKPTTSLLDVSASDPAPVDMMAGLTVSSTKPAVTDATTKPDNGIDILGEPATTTAAPAAPSADVPSSGFGFLGQSTTAAPASTSADESAFNFLGDAPAAPAAPPASGMDDLLLSMIDAPAKPAPAKPADPFADLVDGPQR